MLTNDIPVTDIYNEIMEKHVTSLSEFYKSQDIKSSDTDAILICFSSQGIFNCREKFNKLPITEDAMFEFSISFNRLMHQLMTLLYWNSTDKGCLGINAVQVARKLNLFTSLELDQIEGKTTSLYIYLPLATKEMVQTLIFFRFFAQRQFMIPQDMMNKIPVDSRREAMESMTDFCNDTSVFCKVLEYLDLQEKYMWYITPDKIASYDFDDMIEHDTMYPFDKYFVED